MPSGRRRVTSQLWSARSSTSVTRPSHHLQSTVTPPRATSPLNEPVCHAVGSAGRRSTRLSWLWRSISIMPAAPPKLPSIWNGGWAQKRFGYVPPRSPASVSAGSRSERSSRSARSPSPRRAQKHIFHARDHPVPASPRISRVWRAAAISSGVERDICAAG